MAHSAELAAVAAQLAAPGKGLLASDESTGTIGKRLEKAGLPNTEEVRRSYRELYYTAPGMGQYISGVIMFKETLYQSASNGKTFVQCLAEQGILPGIKVDEGLAPLEGGAEGETYTKGLENLAAAAAEYAKAGAKFAKWRATIKVADGLPTDLAVETNADHLAQYAKICQSAGLVPIVEPEILIDGAHSIERFGAVTERVVAACTAALWRHGVLLEGTLLKPQMVIPGADAAKASPDQVAEHTVNALRRVVPAAIPGIMFLSGGQTEEEATVNLNAINVAAQRLGRCPWSLSFSFGRALQASVLKHWSGDASKAGEAQALAVALAKANNEAALGRYAVGGAHPSVLSVESLKENFRGWTQH